jgi:hypothetical protein
MLFFFEGNGTYEPSATMATALWTLLDCLVAMLGPVQKHWWLFKENGKLSSAFEKSNTSAVGVYPYGEMNLNPTLGIHFRIAKSRMRWRCNFKGLSQDGRGLIFLKTSAPQCLMSTHRKSLLSARSIWLDIFPRKLMGFGPWG